MVPIDVKEAKEPLRLLEPMREDREKVADRGEDGADEEAVEEEEVEERRPGLKASSQEPTCFLDHIGNE